MKTYKVHTHNRSWTVKADSFKLTSASPDDPHVYEFKQGDDIVAIFEFHACVGVAEHASEDS